MTRRPRRIVKGKRLNKRQKKEVKRLIGIRQELKFQNYNQAPASITTTYTVTGAPYDIAQGITDSQRVGDSILWCGKIDLTIEVVNGLGATADAYNNLRFILFQWHPATTPTAASLLLSGPSSTQDVYSNYNHDNRQMYKVLLDKVFVTSGGGVSATVPWGAGSVKYRRFHVSTKKLTKHVQYTAGGSTATNRLYVMFASDSALATHPTMLYSSKVFYRDG